LPKPASEGCIDAVRASRRALWALLSMRYTVDGIKKCPHPEKAAHEVRPPVVGLQPTDLIRGPRTGSAAVSKNAWRWSSHSRILSHARSPGVTIPQS